MIECLHTSNIETIPRLCDSGMPCEDIVLLPCATKKTSLFFLFFFFLILQTSFIGVEDMQSLNMLTLSYVLPTQATPCFSFSLVTEMTQKECGSAPALNSTDIGAMVSGHKVISPVQQTVEKNNDSRGCKALQEQIHRQASSL